jgi:hypothetical protein
LEMLQKVPHVVLPPESLTQGRRQSSHSSSTLSSSRE